MARSDLLLNLVRARSKGDDTLFRQTVEAIISEERHKQHHTLANQLAAEIERNKSNTVSISKFTSKLDSLIYELIPRKTLNDLVLQKDVISTCEELIEEQRRFELLNSYNLEPRNRILLLGPPGNGKTSLAEGIAEAISVPLISVRYESVIGSFLGETNSRLNQVFEYVKSRRCVLFFDEFDTIGKERGDRHDSGEIKRVVSTLLMQIDNLPSYVVVVAATNHAELLDRAAWRRFQIKLELREPNSKLIADWLEKFWLNHRIDFKLNIPKLSSALMGLSFSEIENFNLNVLRKIVLAEPNSNANKIMSDHIARLVKEKGSRSRYGNRRE